MLWHYKHLDFERNAAREVKQGLRLGKTDVANGLAQHYLQSKLQLDRRIKPAAKAVAPHNRRTPDSPCARASSAPHFGQCSG